MHSFLKPDQKESYVPWFEWKEKWITVTEARENNFMNQRGLLGLDIIEVIYNTSPYI